MRAGQLMRVHPFHLARRRRTRPGRGAARPGWRSATPRRSLARRRAERSGPRRAPRSCRESGRRAREPERRTCLGLETESVRRARRQHHRLQVGIGCRRLLGRRLRPAAQHPARQGPSGAGFPGAARSSRPEASDGPGRIVPGPGLADASLSRPPRKPEGDPTAGKKGPSTLDSSMRSLPPSSGWSRIWSGELPAIPSPKIPLAEVPRSADSRQAISSRRQRGRCRRRRAPCRDAAVGPPCGAVRCARQPPRIGHGRSATGVGLRTYASNPVPVRRRPGRSQ
jgi:hypothetical protein